MKKILTIVGARPQFIKAAAMSRVFKTLDDIEEIILHTGQHYDVNMSNVFFEELNIPKPDYNLALGSGEREEQISKMSEGISQIIVSELPDLVLVYGDTNSTLAGAQAASDLKVPLAHIEAGLRSYNEEMPEELNRILTDRLSSLLYSPTEEAVDNLKNEKFSLKDPLIQLSGDIMLDNTLYFSELSERSSEILDEFKLTKGGFILATCHRPSNTDNKESINSIFSALYDLSEKEKIKVILPIHPRTRKMGDKFLDQELLQKIDQSKYFIIINPVSFIDMIALEANCKLIITDSGGVQKEAFFLQKPCIVLRKETEWVELVKNGNAILCGSNRLKIVESYEELMQKKFTYPQFYGDGKASKKIAMSILEFLNN